ncbi:MAG: ATP synthase subunit I [Blastocatellales bacterium]
MSQIDDSGIERRFQRNTYVVIVVALAAGWFLSGWRMALGVVLGGALCLFNLRWLSGSVRAILSKAVMTQSGRVPPFTASKLILRYFVIAFVIVAALSTGYFHPLGIGTGFAAFAGGVMIEAVYQLYLFFRSFKTNENA